MATATTRTSYKTVATTLFTDGEGNITPLSSVQTIRSYGDNEPSALLSMILKEFFNVKAATDLTKEQKSRISVVDPRGNLEIRLNDNVSVFVAVERKDLPQDPGTLAILGDKCPDWVTVVQEESASDVADLAALLG